jgi:hypothetical protein
VYIALQFNSVPCHWVILRRKLAAGVCLDRILLFSSVKILLLLLLLLPLLSRSETWIVMDLMDRGNLASAVRHSSMFIDDGKALNAVSVLILAIMRLCLAYAHRNAICCCVSHLHL